MQHSVLNELAEARGVGRKKIPSPKDYLFDRKGGVLLELMATFIALP